MRYELRPQKWTEEYRYDDGFALWDTVAGKQYGWTLHKYRGEAEVAQDNADDEAYRAAADRAAAEVACG